MRVERRSNQRLREALAAAGWTGQQLAAAVCAVGAENGIMLHYDRTAVAHWLAGTEPRSPVPELVAEAFSRRLGRPVAPEQLGLASARLAARVYRGGAAAVDSAGAARHGLAAEGDPVADLRALSVVQQGRRRPLGSAYSLASLSVPAWPSGVSASALAAASAGPGRTGTRRVGRDDVVAAEAMVTMFAALDAIFGGGQCRRALAAYLAADLAPRLEEPMRPQVRRRLTAAATQLAYLCAFMCFDDEHHGLAQRYYLTALRLAADNDDQAAYAVTLRALSVQAHALGHYRHALQLAETATCAARHTDPARRAFFLGQQAVAHAACGDRFNALTSLTAAERHVDHATSQAPSGSDVIGACHPASPAHQQAVVQAQLGDLPGAIAALAFSIRRRPATEPRSRVITLARLAELQLDARQLEAATETWQRFLDGYPTLHSHRASTALRTLQTRLRPHATHPSVRALLQQANHLTTHTIPLPRPGPATQRTVG